MQIRPLDWKDSPGEGNGNPLQYSCLENPMDRGAWRAMVHGVTKSQTQLNRLSTLPSPVLPARTALFHMADSCFSFKIQLSGPLPRKLL